MSYREFPDPEPEQVDRTPAGVGERLIVLLSATVLITGLLIAVANFLSPDEVAPVAEESAPASPAGSADATPGERPHFVITMDPGQTSIEGEPLQFFWVRAVEDVAIHSEPSPDAPENGILEAGDVAVVRLDGGAAQGPPGWVHLFAPMPTGWVRVEEGGATLVEDFPNAYDRYRPGGEILNVATRGTAFLALGKGPTAADGLWVASSSDGVDWRRPESSAVPQSWGRQTSMAWGPAGWLASDNAFPAPALWRSEDGLSWSLAGGLSQLPLGEYLYGVSGGYLLSASMTHAPGYWSSGSSLWFSANGTTWSETLAFPGDRASPPEVRVGPAGVYAWPAEGTAPDASSGASGWHSPDGQAWSLVAGGPSGPAAQVAVLGDRMVGLDRDPQTAQLRSWVALLDGAAAARWIEESGTLPFADAFVALFTGDGDRALAISWTPGSEDVAAWTTRDGSRWNSVPMPPGGFGTIPHRAVGSEQAVVVVGVDAESLFSVPALWRLAGDTWSETPASELASRAAADREPACPDPPSDALDYLLLDPWLGATCFGSEALRFTAWSSGCDVSGLPCIPGIDRASGADWLQSPYLSGLRLSPFASPFDPGLDLPAEAVLAPGLRWVADWQDAWLEVTGHFNDPAAAECAQAVTVIDEASYPGRESVVDGCRARFVVTAVRVVDSP